jgi:fimbrial chaperone protein
MDNLMKPLNMIYKHLKNINKSFASVLGDGLILLLLLWTPWAQAGSFTVSPVRVSLSASAPISAITVQNNGTEAVVLQLEAMAWAQQAGLDVYTPSTDILATPPIITIPGGGSQILRVGLRRAPDPKHELTYLLYLQEVPPPPKPGFSGLQMALRFALPVFVSPAAEDIASLAWRITRAQNGQHEVSLSNSGNAHVQVANFKLARADGGELGTQQVTGYVLPGQTVTWKAKDIKVPPSGNQLRLIALTDIGEINADLITVDGVAASSSPIPDVGAIDSGIAVAEPK